MKKVLFPGSFDPVTNAHLDIMKRLLKMGFEVEVGIFNNSVKNGFFSQKERLEMITAIIENLELKNIRASIQTGLLVNVCKEQKINLIARGIRSIKDYEYEKEMEYNNKQLNNEIEYLYLNASVDNNYVSSTVVRELIAYKTAVNHLVPKEVVKIINTKGGK